MHTLDAAVHLLDSDTIQYIWICTYIASYPDTNDTL